MVYTPTYNGGIHGVYKPINVSWGVLVPSCVSWRYEDMSLDIFLINDGWFMISSGMILSNIYIYILYIYWRLSQSTGNPVLNQPVD